MINAQINLIPLIFDQSCGRYKIFSTSLDNQLTLPKIDIEPYLDMEPALDHLLENCIDTKSLYHNFKLTDIIIEDILHIYYIVFIMHETTIHYGSMMDTKNITNLPTNAKKIISLL